MLLQLFLATTAVALEQTPLESVTLRADTRYDNIDWGDERDRLQNSALVAFTLDLFWDVDLAAMATTGDDFTSRWATYRDLQGGDPERMALSARQLYLQRWFGPVRLQAGSLAPVKGAASASGLEDLGWIDGVRGEVHAESGFVVEVVGGSLTDVDEPDLFIRERALDYGELELGTPLPLGFEAEAAAHHLGENTYAKTELGWSDEAGRWPTWRVEGGVNLQQGAFLGVAQTEVDVLFGPTGNESLKERIEFTGRCRLVQEEYGVFGALSEDFYQFGAECMTRLDGKIDNRRIVSWNVRYIAPMSPDLLPRFNIGLTTKLKLDRPESDPG